MKKRTIMILILLLCVCCLSACGCEHEWNEATCTTPKTCSKCGTTVGEATHKSGEWEITKEATYRISGEKVKKCEMCGEILETTTYSLPKEEQIAYFKNECVSYSYDEIARYPDNYVLCKAKFTGEVAQVMEIDDDYILLVNVTRGTYSWEDTIYVVYKKQSDEEPRILEDDIITMYGYLSGTTTYETVLGSSATLPLFDVEYIEIN